MKKILFLLLLVSTSTFAQIEHGLLVGAGVGFPLQDSWKRTTWGDESNWSYRHDYKLNSMIVIAFDSFRNRNSFMIWILRWDFRRWKRRSIFLIMKV